ncbi:MAG: MerR family transcriptional regulator [Ignavibacteria bacterium]|nr:MerR family transcriptional regulator [Ignavibacteria bacterium]
MKNNQTEKLYYSISDVSQIIDEEQYVLRYWEREFSAIKPRKNSAGNRAYTAKDVAIILKIRSMLRDELLTIQGAKDALRSVNLESIEEYKPVPTSKNEDYNTVINGSKRKLRSVVTPGISSHQSTDTVTLHRQDVLDLCQLLKDMSLIINYM